MSTPPRLLIVSLQPDWYGLLRLPKQLQAAGFEVAIFSHPDSLLARTRHADQHFSFNPHGRIRGARSKLGRVVCDWRPDLLIPADEPAMFFLRDTKTDLPPFTGGESAPQPVAGSKILTRGLAESLSIQVPPQAIADTPAAARRFVATHGFPVILKEEFGAGGQGITPCRNNEHLARGLRHRPRLPRWLTAILRDWQILPYMPITGHRVIQPFIEGDPVTYSLVSRDGKILAGYAAVALDFSSSPFNPASVLRTADLPQVADAAGLLIGKLNWTGFASVDFILAPTGEAIMLECNLRPTPGCLVGDEAGTDLVGALFEALTGGSRARGKPCFGKSIPLFPQEWIRDPSSAHISQATDRIPFDDPELLAELQRRHPRLQTSLERLTGNSTVGLP